MYTRSKTVNARSLVAALAIAGALFAGSVAAADRAVIVAIPVNAHGLDVSQPAGAQELYRRLDYAAYVACTRANRVGLAPSTDPRGCSEKSLASAIRSVDLPLLTQMYLRQHTLREAATYGIEPAAKLAAK
jgi:UrcA family protein